MIEQLWQKFENSYYKRRLKDNNYAFMYNEAPKDEWVSFDTETTGLDPKKAEIISIGAVKVKGNRIIASERFECLVRPEKGIDENAIKIHHLRHCDVEGGLSPFEAIGKLVEFIGSRPLVGYYLEFDVALVNRYLLEFLGVKLPQKKIEISGLYFDHKIGLIPQANIDLKFDTILKELDLPSLGKHDALNDAIMTALIFIKLKELQ